MKKILLLSAFSMFALSSLAMNKNKNIEKKILKLYIVWYHCGDGSHGSFYINDLSGAQSVANHLCG